MRKIFSLLFMVTMLVSPLFAHAPKQLNATHRIAMDTQTINPFSGKKGNAICSATAVGPHTLLTAAHCDTGDNFITIDDTNVAIVTDRVKDGADHELITVGFPNPNKKFEEVAEFEQSDALQKGDDIWMEGNAAGWPQLVRRGVYSGNMVIDGKVVELYDYNGFFGDSGSAIFDEHGKIVAVTNVLVSSANMFSEFKMMGAWPLHFTAAQIAQAAKE